MACRRYILGSSYKAPEMSGQLYAPKKEPLLSIVRRLDGPQSQSEYKCYCAIWMVQHTKYG